MSFIRLSPSTLNLFNECPRCFWLHINKNVHRPRGIFPSLPGGMDLVIKKYFDKYRAKGILPPEIKGKVDGELFPDLKLLNQWRNWRTGLSCQDKKIEVILSGALDDCLVEDGFFIPLDYKTRGSALKEDPRKYYQTQLDCYGLLLEANGFKIKPFAYLVYYYPREVRKNGLIKFNVKPIKIEIDLKRAKNILKDSMALLGGPIPSKHSGCEYCRWNPDEFD